MRPLVSGLPEIGDLSSIPPSRSHGVQNSVR